MKKILLFLFFIVMVSCNTSKRTWSSIGEDTFMMTTIDTIVTENVFVDICEQEQINPNYNAWLKTYFQDYETKDKIIEYCFIKSDSVLYRLIIDTNDSTFNIIKRITFDR